MKNLIEFKLHGGSVPYFVSDYLGGISIDNKFYGISCDDTGSDYLPSTVVKFTRDEFIAKIKTAAIDKSVEELFAEMGKSIPMTDEEKEAFIVNWLTERNM